MAENQHVIQALGPNRPHPPFCNGVRLWRFYRCSDLPDPKGSDPSIELCTIAAIAVMDEISRWTSVPIRSLHDLLGQPSGRRMSRHSSMDNLPCAVINDEEHIERPEPDCVNREKVAGPDFLGVLCEKLAPAR